MLARIGKAWDMLTAALLAAAAALWLPPAVLNRVTAELITFFGIQAAVILPAMIFTAGILRPEGLSLPEARRYRKALRGQMKFWIVLLALDFMTVGSMILGKAVNWIIVVSVPRWGWELDITPALLATTVFLGFLAVVRTIPFVRGVMSLQSMSADLTEMAIKARNRGEIREQENAIAETPFKKPDGFGRIISRH